MGLAGALLRRMPGEGRNAVQAALGRLALRRQAYGPLLAAPAVALAQRFALAFNLGLLGAMLVLHLPLVDLRFGWQSSYPIRPAQMHAAVQALAAPWGWALPQAQPTEAEVATALGLLSTAITATSFIVSVVVANRVYARLGVASGAIVLPIVYLVGFGLWIVQFTFATAVIVRFTQQVTQRGISNASWSAFYNVVPSAPRAQVLAFMDGVPGQLGTILSGLLLLAAGTILAPTQVFLLGAGTAVVATIVAAAVALGGCFHHEKAVTHEPLKLGSADVVVEQVVRV